MAIISLLGYLPSAKAWDIAFNNMAFVPDINNFSNGGYVLNLIGSMQDGSTNNHYPVLSVKTDGSSSWSTNRTAPFVQEIPEPAPVEIIVFGLIMLGGFNWMRHRRRSSG